MVARVIRVVFPDGKRNEAVAILRDGMGPIARQQPGWRGLLVLSDPASNRGLVISLWERAEDANGPSDAYRAQAARFEGVLAEAAVRELFDVQLSLTNDESAG